MSSTLSSDIVPPIPISDNTNEKPETKLYPIPQPNIDLSQDDISTSDLTPRKKYRRVGHLAVINDHIQKLEDKHYKCGFNNCSYTPQLNATRVRKHILKCHSDAVPSDIPMNYYSPPNSPLEGLLGNTHHIPLMTHLIPKDPKNQESFQVCVHSESLSFSAAHFIAYKGYREKLHGHNYTLSLAMKGDLSADGYVLNFTELKKVLKKICEAYDHRVLIPTLSDVLKINQGDANVEITCEDDSTFMFPKTDCICLPIVHSSVEELSKLICHQLIETLGREAMRNRKIQTLSLSVAETPTQYGTYTVDI